MVKPRTYVYIDGLNLYYRAAKGTPYKWLDLEALCDRLLPANEVVKVKYFTTRVRGVDWNPDGPARQEPYLRALRTLPRVEIIYGQFAIHDVWMPRTERPGGANRCQPLERPAGREWVEVVRVEEKGSDVNLAVHLVRDGFRQEYEVAAVLTNDSDFCEAVRVVRYDLGLPVGVISPQKRASVELARLASFTKRVSRAILQASQLPHEMTDAAGPFHKPAAWDHPDGKIQR